ncbi:FHA domain-containing protein [Rhodovulum sp. 12E13]|nr:FHA domain-containing protein [Rhodovulum sp. 12E13]
MIAYARAQVARIAEAGMAEDLGDGHGAGRAKTRLLGFQSRDFAARDPFSQGASDARRGPMFPIGWVVVTAGPGRGASYALTAGVATLGRGDDQTVCLDFGDTAISRQAHASIAYDPETNCVYLGAGAKSNLVRLNDRPVLATEQLEDGDTIRIGETTLRFAALCGPDFAWTGAGGSGGGRDAAGEG